MFEKQLALTTMERLTRFTDTSTSRKEVFIPRETLYHTFDVTLVVEDDKEFKAHRQVLSDASPFFDKLLNSNMRESTEEVIRLGMLTEADLRDVLDFLYTGSVKILTEDHARDLYAVADYLFLRRLQAFCQSYLARNLNSLNCISTYYFAKRYNSEKLVRYTKQFVLTNFTTVAKGEEFRNLSNEDVEMWISSDDIDVIAEEDVFKIIATWIDHDKSERRKHFTQLFRNVRLVCVSPDHLREAILTNNLVKECEDCLDRTKGVLKSVNSKNFDNTCISEKPRKSYETPIIVGCKRGEIFCYFPREDNVLKISSGPLRSFVCCRMFSSHDGLYFLNKEQDKLFRYNSVADIWSTLPYTGTRNLVQIFLSNRDEIYALANERYCAHCKFTLCLRSGYPFCKKSHDPSSIMKYNPISNSWEVLSTFKLGKRCEICIIAKDNFIYFIGGELSGEHPIWPYQLLKVAHRYDLSTSRWDRVADMQQARCWPSGATSHGKIFITSSYNETCEEYNEATNEWHFIPSLPVPNPLPSRLRQRMLQVDGKLYVLYVIVNWEQLNREWQSWTYGNRVLWYDPDMNEWHVRTTVMPLLESCCSMRVFKGSVLRNASPISDWPWPATDIVTDS